MLDKTNRQRIPARYWMFICVLLFGPSASYAQYPDREVQAIEAKSAAERIALSKKKSVNVVLRDLRRLQGTIVGVYDDSFGIRPKAKDKALTTIGSRSTNRRLQLIRYRDVLQMQGEGVAVSFVPDPQLSPFASWDDVRSIGVGEYIVIRTADGKTLRGAFLSADGDQAGLMTGNKQVSIPAGSVAKIYRVAGKTKSLVDKALKGTSKGAEATDSVLPIGSPSAGANPAAIGIGAAVGAALYLIDPRKPTLVLVYSR